MAKVHNHLDATGRLPNVVDSEDISIHRFLSFAAMLARVHARLPPKARTALEGRVRGALKDDSGLGSLAYELGVAAHLMMRGFDVNWSDLENGGGFDFFCVKAGLEIEVECKTVSGDLGRSIHLVRQSQMGGLIRETLGAAVSARGSTVAEVRTEGRLSGSELNAIAHVITTALQSGKGAHAPGLCQVTVHHFEKAASPFAKAPLSQYTDLVRAFVREQFNCDTQHHLMMVEANGGEIGIVSLYSNRPDQVLKGVYRDLKSAANQLSTSRPGIICMQFQHMPPEDLLEVAREPERTQTPSGLQLVMARFCESPKREHVHSVKFTAPGIISRKQWVSGVKLHTTTMEQSPSYVFTNNGNPMARDQRLAVFI